MVLALLLILSACGGQPQAVPSVPEGAEPPAAADTSTPPEEAPPAEATPVPEEAAPVPQPEAAAPSTESTEPTETLSRPEPPQQYLQQAGLSPEELETTQLMVVVSEGNEAILYGFAADETGLWTQALGPYDGHVGKNGVTGKKTEGDGKTPTGLFPIPFAFGIRPDPGGSMLYRQVTADSYWVDDSASPYYNQWVESADPQGWTSAEHLIDYDSAYAYAAVIGYNLEPVVPGAGSAIFFHCGSRATAGCISASEAVVLEFLSWLDPQCNPSILIL